jgi:hypothetical protein
MYHASSVAASVARRMWCTLLIGSDGIDVDRIASARLRADHRKEREDTLARRSPSASMLAAKWNESAHAQRHRGSNQSSSSISLTDDNSSDLGDGIWQPEHLVLVDRAADFDCTFIVVIDGGAHMARDNGARHLFAALEAMFDAVSPVASESAGSAPVSPGKQVRRLVTLLLCRRTRCLQVAANLDVVADRALIKQAFDSIEFRGLANMALGLTLATQLVPQNMACFVCVFNASPAPPNRSGAEAIELMQSVCRARYEAVTGSFSPVTIPSTRRQSTFDAEPLGGEKERGGPPPLAAFAFACGDVADSTLLRVWCSRTGIGQFHWVACADAFASATVASIKNALAIQAHSLVVRVIPEAGCRVWPAVTPYSSTLENERDTLVYIPTVFAGERHRLPFQLFVPAVSEAGAAPTFVVNLSFVLVRDNNRKVSYSRRFAMPRLGVTAINALESQFVHREVLRCMLADALQKAIYAADGDKFDAAQSIITVAIARMRASVDSERLLSNLAQSNPSTPSSSTQTPPTTVQHSASWSSLSAGRQMALQPPSPVALAAGSLDASDAIAAWLKYVSACVQVLFRERDTYGVARHSANAILSSLMLERVSHWRLPLSLLDAATALEIGPPPPDPYERITAIAQSPVTAPSSETRRAAPVPSGIIPLDASGNVIMSGNGTAASSNGGDATTASGDDSGKRRRRKKATASSELVTETDESPQSSAGSTPRNASSPRIGSSPRRLHKQQHHHHPQQQQPQEQ